MSRLFDLHGDPLDPASDRDGGAEGASGDLGRGPSEPPGLGVLDILMAMVRSVRHYPLIAVGVCLVLLVVGLAAVDRRFQPSYRAEAVLRVAPILPRVLYADEEWHKRSIHGYLDDHVRTLLHLVRERPVLECAIEYLERDEVDWLPAGVDSADAVNHLRARLQVEVLRDTQLFTIALDDNDPTLPAPVVNAVVGSFLARQVEEESLEHDTVAASLREERELLQAELDDCHTELDKLGDRLGSASLDERQNIFFQRFGPLQDGLTKILIRKMEVEARLEASRQRAAELVIQTPPGLVESLVESDPAVMDARVMLERMRRELWTATEGLAPSHPDRIEHTARFEKTREEVERAIGVIRGRVRDNLEMQRREEARDLVAEAERALAGAESEERRMREVLDAARRDLAVHGQATLRAREQRDRETRLLTALSGADERLELLRTEARAPYRVSLRSPASSPRKPVKDRRPMLSILVFFSAAASAPAASLIVAQLYGRIRDRGDVARMGLPLLADDDGTTLREVAGRILVNAPSRGPNAPRFLVAAAGPERVRVRAEQLADELASLSETGPGLRIRVSEHATDSILESDEHTRRFHVLSVSSAPGQFAARVTGRDWHERIRQAMEEAPVTVVSGPSLDGRLEGWPGHFPDLDWIVVAECQGTSTGELKDAVSRLERFGVRPAGVVLTESRSETNV